MSDITDAKAPTSKLATRKQAHEALLAYHLMQVTSAQAVAAEAARLRIAPADMRVLYYLTVEPNRTPKRVATHLGLTTGAVTTLVDRLVHGGYVTRTPNPDDRRSVFLELTDTGRAAALRLEDAYLDVMVVTISADDAKALTRGLTTISRGLEAAGVTR